ncbi:MAG TPA: response regulator [Candidatus Eremiobacteraeota bacterium]|nr:MAG: Alkaline phosphatase synthesis transcriptional regulatory protein PhoP [bacterium ADurb.Bin363]HPZ10139.1 response regulator [Candidatus Eremiobacteraeota bacterium]
MSQKKILLVDDEPNIIKSLNYVLQKKGFAVLCASNGEEAIDRIRSFKPDIVLLDIMMPKKNGYDVCEEIRKEDNFKNLYIIMLTARGQSIDKEKGLHAGANEYMTKPFSPGQILQKIEDILQK